MGGLELPPAEVQPWDAMANEVLPGLLLIKGNMYSSPMCGNLPLDPDNEINSRR